MNQSHTSTSKFLSYVLRHKPDTIGIALDSQGWVNIDKLLAAVASQGRTIHIDELRDLVQTNDKQRFSISSDGQRIRASQGHTLNNIELDLQPQTPPSELYHGTVSRFLDSIRKQGLLKMQRQYVHLSATRETAISVGSRRGKPVVLAIDTIAMSQNGHQFYLSDNSVWLVDSVPPQYLREHC